MTMKKNSRILVLGLGRRTGLAASNFLADIGHEVWVSDNKQETELEDIIKQLDRSVIVAAGEQSVELLDQNFDHIILSPGVPKSIPLVRAAIEKNIPVISEIELAYDYIKGHIIGITGTDGKSTTTSLTGHILKELGIKSVVGGNIGIPLISLTSQTSDRSVTVVELSSYQLETIKSFKPDAAAILNISRDHMDRYTGMDEYFKAKLRIAENQGVDEFFIYNGEDNIITQGIEGIKSKKICFSINNRDADAFFDNGYIYVNYKEELKKIIDTGRMQIMGIHNVENTMAALLLVISALNKMDIKPDFSKIEQSCYTFKGLAHRMEYIGKHQGRNFINDSKATTVGAVEMAVKSLKQNSVLILGGRTKGDDYSKLIKPIKEKISHLILIGESTEEFSIIFNKITRSTAKTMEEAVTIAMDKSGPGDTIILSPACASFDMFDNFEERGNTFKESFNKLVKGELSWTTSR